MPNSLKQGANMAAKPFYLVRLEDASGVSGTGRVAQGIVFDNGRVAMTWLSEHPSTTVYDNLGEVRAIHGHEGRTEIQIEPDWKRIANELKAAIKNFSLSSAIMPMLPNESASSVFLKDLPEKEDQS